jgi:DNA topoisomerase-2
MQSRLTGGRHGYGAKLTNIFSKQFSVETYDKSQGLLFSQQWKKNMFDEKPPVIKACDLPGDYTKITFEPDFEKFGVAVDENDSLANNEIIKNSKLLFQRRVIDIAGCLPSISVSLNGEVIDVKSFVDYIKLYSRSFEKMAATVDAGAIIADDGSAVEAKPAAENVPASNIFYAKVNDRWEIGVIPSPSSTFESISFVNSIWTSQGGTHVNHVVNQVVEALDEQITKKLSSGNLKRTVHTGNIRNRLMVFLRCNVENPSFDSQSKNTLTTKPSKFGSECELPAPFLKEIVQRSGIVDDIVAAVRFSESLALHKASSSSKNKAATVIAVPKLDDAHYAGHPTKSLDCTLILTEGDSAKALAVAGLEVVGRETFGVLPLKGKLLNVRVATTKQLSDNEELMNLCKAIGLDFSKTYKKGLEGQGLRYGKVLLMCDQDTDGSHIKGLVINFFHKFWPALLQQEGFLQQFITPLVKVRPVGAGGSSSSGSNSSAGGTATKKSSSKKKSSKQADPSAIVANASTNPNIKSFYSMLEYLQWRQEQASELTKFNIKYYKGLGTNTNKEGREYFSQLGLHKKTFTADGSEDDIIDMVFNKLRANDRKNWLLETDLQTAVIDFVGTERIPFTEFINKELVHFSAYDNQRSIPNVIDGLKPSQRKVLYSCFKRNLTQDSKVVQVAGYVAEKTAYHHGETSLHSTIIRMAQDFVGSNNVPYLVPSGQFGSRAEGGQDFASPRYIFTRLSPLARLLFPAEDDGLLEYLEEDGMEVEPKYFVPILPTILLNGAEGIGTGWSTSIPSYDPVQLAKQFITRIKNDGNFGGRGLLPWARGFSGKIYPQKGSATTQRGFFTQGVATRLTKTSIEITELPVGTWTNDYKEFLVELVKDGSIKSFSEHHTSTAVRFEVNAPQVWVDAVEKAGLEKTLRLITPVSTKNMHAFDKECKIKLYLTAEDMVEEHFHVRRRAYYVRKELMAAKLAREARINNNKSRFISGILDGSISIINTNTKSAVSEDQLIQTLMSKGFETTGQIDHLCKKLYLKTSMSSQAPLLSPGSGVGPQTDGADNGQVSDYNDAAEGHARAGFDYLTSLPIHSLTEAKHASLVQKAEQSSRELELLLATKPEDMWIKDINVFVEKFTKELKRTD